jgi:hypothetical protein
MFRGWQQRKVSLQDSKLCYSKLKGSEWLVMGILNFDLYLCKLSVERMDDFIFEVTVQGNQRRFSFKADNPISYNAWTSAIGLALDSSLGK